MSEKIAFIGAGAMAEALIAGIINAGDIPAPSITATNKGNPKQLTYMKHTYGINVRENLLETVAEANIIILAVKPKDAAAVLFELKSIVKQDMLIISVMAGISTQYIVKMLEKDVSVIRAMPNTSATIGLSATAIAKGDFANESAIEISNKILGTVGMVKEVSEPAIDTITAIAGSGPAYFYYIVEAMEQAALELGLAKEDAMPFIQQTILGAAEMLRRSEDSPAELRKKITSPAGTTEAGLNALMDAHVGDSMKVAIKRAYQRSKQLGEATE